ncbi:DNA polymerase III subunit gamma and tau [Agromyces sp. CFH 90414]|uniref:DNA-directed DNA polymerase n=1 Tax=Agromyces agglutinans TaxID=2662258 RepID=A0A6I2F923_9MICO|nr:DNA polymerase III subunit gamma and tau [Agromyces agglutinans]MRG61129.1 DNA polymerase III subunit gamma and tau [Agromyces agglutinans]
MVTALYRRYRPETFAEMIGQSQVTEPLMTALRTDRVNHAYLFSGPRGCGKTTSARILARCLNCAEGPTDTPCGTCPSCVELSRGGGGSLDVVEIDAASHNGVDDARDLRERAVFAPARDRYKIFILDEAHMVTPQGFNALLKLVEEPPEHVKFIFATTEPDKVLGTIRSRTHHYPFRLVPPAPMLEYVQQLCEEEGIQVQPGVLALVVRAGGGSPRDTLSLLDQLIAGSEGSTIDYERAVALLGYTHGALLDEVVDAIGAKDAAGAFAAADRVVQTGQDPRRFVEDLLERLRDLIVVAASSPEAAAAVLRGLPQDELARMAAQAKAFGQAELSRVADLVNQTLTEMTGATSPRLHLELMLARVLVPASDDTARGALARVERLERRVGVEGAVPAGGGGAGAGAPVGEARRVESAPEREAPVPAAAAAASPAMNAPAVDAPARAPQRSAEPVASGVGGAAASGGAAGAGAPANVPRPAPVGPVSLQQVKDAWPEVLASLQRTKRSAWMVAFTAQVRDYRDDDVLVLGFPSEQDVAGFRGGPPGQSVGDLLRNAIAEVLGVRVKFIARAEGPGARAGTADGAEPGGGAGGAAGLGEARPAGAPSGGAATPSAGGGPSVGSGAAARSSEAGTVARSSNGSAPSGRGPDGAGGGTGSGPNGAPGRSASARSTSAAPAGPVGSWATVAIPADPASADGAGGTSVVDERTAPASGGGGSAVGAATRAADHSAPTAVAVAERPGHAVDDDLPSDDDAPPEDFEPPFDPGPGPDPDAGPAPAAPAVQAGPVAPAKSRTAAPARSAAPARRPAARPASDGIQRYGESVVREVLGATFLEEVELPARGFGERG